MLLTPTGGEGIYRPDVLYMRNFCDTKLLQISHLFALSRKLICESVIHATPFFFSMRANHKSYIFVKIFEIAVYGWHRNILVHSTCTCIHDKCEHNHDNCFSDRQNVYKFITSGICGSTIVPTSKLQQWVIISLYWK